MTGPVLVTGFGAFPGAPINPTERLVARLADEGAVVAAVLPVTWAGTRERLREILTATAPRAVLMFGLATGARTIRIETRAENRARQAVDTEGVMPADPVLDPAGPAFQAVGSLAKSVRDAVRAARGRAVLSRDAGAYLCNAALWEALTWRGTGPAPVAFVHVPLRPPEDLEPFARAALAALVDKA